MRSYRLQLQQGQTSPLYLGGYATQKIIEVSELLNRSVSVIDIGCGSGEMMVEIMRVAGSYINTVTGIDWSAPAIERLQSSHYTKTVLCKSSTLPFADKEFDIAISIENLEHLYKDDVVPAIVEMSRVADNIVIVTPTVHNVINMQWLTDEISEASADSMPISESEFFMLEGAVHKSVVLPDSMLAAGFSIGFHNHGRFSAVSKDIDVTKIKVIGLQPDYSNESRTVQYVQLLLNSKNLQNEINESL